MTSSVAGANVNLNGDGQPSGNAPRIAKDDSTSSMSAKARLKFGQQPEFIRHISPKRDTNVVLRLGQTYNNLPGSTPHKLKA